MNAIEMNSINKKHEYREVFKDFSMTVEKGDFVIINGASGTGKTTLLNMLCLLEPFDSGKYKLFDKNVNEFKSKEIRLMFKNDISYIFQNFALIDNYSIKENLLINRKYSNAELKEALNKVGMSNMDINTKIYKLSGGEQQRVSLAKIFLKNPKIIFADEPTGSLDKGNRNLVMEALKELNTKGTTIIIVTHDDSLLKYANKNIML